MYNVNQASPSASTIAAIPLAFLATEVQAIDFQSIDTQPPSDPIQVYQTNAETSSFRGFEEFFQDESERIDSEFVHAVAQAYTSLLKNQETLGDEFEAVLYEDFWELCEA